VGTIRREDRGGDGASRDSLSLSPPEPAGKRDVRGVGGRTRPMSSMISRSCRRYFASTLPSPENVDGRRRWVGRVRLALHCQR
jgi:hypothetical protein